MVVIDCPLSLQLMQSQEVLNLIQILKGYTIFMTVMAVVIPKLCVSVKFHKNEDGYTFPWLIWCQGHHFWKRALEQWVNAENFWGLCGNKTVITVKLKTILKRFPKFSISLNQSQTGFRLHYLSQIALIKIPNDCDIDKPTGQLLVLILLDFSTAFDLVDYFLTTCSVFAFWVTNS